ncbi:DNA polymerase III subunit gamma/tau [Cohaesibacter celericrescens]|uniref:DNA polymerase III subunit gamma/tau n=1 Tax=Cohaesibacter celericrescens TaxID=2067669 RepID=A0A2N5XN11_9HYPH|nr:DNA polymerase III subunit gamma/tau [Cohaesibacter celericrescens]PLW75807.1 DNA polymerase III subunit gamma/tau [Cohaesibacter celericrescens]
MDGQDHQTAEGYRVLARKYRPASFDDMIGQDPMIRTLTNAFSSGRIAQAYMMTGVRGVGKTTTARILARALNYEIPGEIDEPTIDMPRLGVHCQAIMEGRHVDIMEMDAASHTSINDIREIIEAARYKPVSARYKVYVIDEVHMLSTAAFNGLLKTLEEPPEHVKFIFATTEIRKVPVTVLSRCQRFDLRRIDAVEMATYMRTICEKEQVEIEDDALQMIARAGEGSARDSLSLLDQAIAHGAGKITSETTRQMLGLADRARVIDLFEAVMKGDIGIALDELKAQYDIGAEPAVVLSDLADFVHLVTRLKLTPDAHSDAAATESEKIRGRDFSGQLSVRVLSRAWQMLLKGLAEVQSSPRPLASAEMVLVRLAYAADLPTPDEALRLLANKDYRPPMPSGAGSGPSTPPDATVSTSAEAQGSPHSGGSPSSNAPTALQSGANLGVAHSAPDLDVGHAEPAKTEKANLRLVASQSDEQMAVRTPPTPQSVAGAEQDKTVAKPEIKPVITRFEQIIALANKHRDIALKFQLESSVRPVSLEQGRVVISYDGVDGEALQHKLGRKLAEWTGERWHVELSGDAGGATLSERKEERERQVREEADGHPLVEAVRSIFPGSKVVDVRINRDFEEEFLAPPVEDLLDEDISLSLSMPDASDLDDDR